MAKAITKKKVTQADYETALLAYVHNSNEISAISAKRDKEIEKLNKKYDPQFEALNKEQDEHFAIVQQYCEDNREYLFEESKSIQIYGANLGFREGKDKVVILESVVGVGLSEKEAEKKALELAIKNKGMANYLRTTIALDKVKIIKQLPPQMAKCGIDVVKEESFFLEPIKTEP